MIKGLDYTGICIVFFCHDGEGRVLMNRRSQNCRDEKGCWDIGGGALEFGERIEDAVRREIGEEYCTNVLSSEFLGFRDIHRVVNGKKSHWLGFDFKVLIDKAVVKNGDPDKIDEIGWYAFDTMPVPLHSQLPTFLDKYKDRLPKK